MATATTTSTVSAQREQELLAFAAARNLVKPANVSNADWLECLETKMHCATPCDPSSAMAVHSPLRSF